MKILILSWRGPGHPNAGGAEVSTHEYAKGWVKAGHSVTLFTSAYFGCKKEEVIDGVKIIRTGRQIFRVHWEAFKWYLFGQHPEFDLVIDQFHGIPFFTPLYVKETKLSFIHEVTKEVWRLNPWPWLFNIIPAIFGTLFESLIFRFIYNHIPFMTVSESTKKDLIEWGISSSQITIIHNGLNAPKLKNIPTKDKKRTLIFLGSISKDKGIEDALKIFAILNKTKEDWQFWIVGKADSRYLIKLKKQSKKLAVDKKVKFWGYVSNQEKFKLISKSHIAINPSIREGWGLVVIEAAAMGTPTIGYDVAGLRDSIVNGKTGILCKPDPTICAKAVIALLSNGDYYRILQQNCLEWSKRFSWDKSVNLSLKLIESLV